ncbi:MAG: hypothetical protein JSV89_14575 [Spirochaetaceae bacterium]|nr:MAG: hypothetical protein JSV89_14575 [Spirochaetaceae bacterium]
MFFWFPFGILFPALFIFLIFRFGMRFFNDLFNNQSRLNSRDRWQIYDRTGFASSPSTKSRSIEGRIFRAAYKHKGRLTVSDIVLETDLGIREAEEMINSMVDGTHVRMEVEDSGLVVYEFPEIISRFEKE